VLGGVDVKLDSSDPASLEELYAIRVTVTFPPRRDRRVVPVRVRAALLVTLIPE
jgi:hypothetical protein